ncbi:MAG: DUF892 family protein [Owenweeksia sp.]|nr:DUF892 family protein [Owenweeksia sp.]
MSRIKNLKDLFTHHIKDLYHAETNLGNVAPALQKAATSEGLKATIKKHGEMIERHKNNLETITHELGEVPEGEVCHAMQGLIKETKMFLEEDCDADVRDAGIIADAQRIAHYFITGYGTLSQWSERLELSADVQGKCKQAVADAEEIDAELKGLAKSHINEEAMA